MKDILRVVMIFGLLLVCGYVHAQIKGINPNNIVSQTIDSNGKVVIGVRVPGVQPPDVPMPVVDLPLASVSLSNIPGFNWSFGCSATSAAMAAGYYDRIGYYNMYAGPTQGGLMPLDNSSWPDVTISGQLRHQCPLSATRNGVDGRTTRGHVDDYWISYGSAANDPYITGGWAQHAWGECTGDYMGTNQSALGNSDGSTTFYFYDDGSPCCNYAAPAGKKDGCYGLRKFYESRGYTVTSNCTQLINGTSTGFTFAQYKAEINAGRPVLIHVTDHTMLGFGYNDTGNLIYLKDTWDYATHSMTWGGSYSGLDQWGVTTITLAAVTPNPCSSVISLGGGGSANAKSYWGGGVGEWYNATLNPCGYYTPGIEQVYSFVAPVSGYYSIQVTAASGYVDYMWKSGACASTGWSCIDDIYLPGTYGSMYMSAGSTYYLLLDDENDTEGEHVFYIFYNPCSNVSNIGGTGSGYSQTFPGGGNGAWYTTTTSPCEYTCPGREKVYSFTPSTTGTYNVVVTSAGSWVDYFWKSSSCASTGWSCIDDIYYTGTYGSMLMTAGVTYYILLDDENTTAGAHTFYIALGEAAGTWEGNVSTDWNNSANWSAGTLPTSVINVTIPGGRPHQPAISGNISAYAKNVTIQSGAILTMTGTTDVNYFYVYGNFNSDAGQFLMSGSNSFVYFQGSDNTYWDDDNENDTYTNVRVVKSLNTAQVTMWQDMTCSGTFEVREGVFAIDGVWTLTVTNTGSAAFQVEDGGKLVLNDETIDCAGDVNFSDGSQAAIAGGLIACAGDFRVDANASYDIVFAGGTLQMDGGITQYITDNDGGAVDLYNLVIAKTAGTCYISAANLDVNGDLTINGGTLSCYNSAAHTSVYNINIALDWDNNVGISGFEEATSTVTFDGGNYHQYCSTETFYTLEVNKPLGGAFRPWNDDVTCNFYNWTAGAVDVYGGSFTAGNLVDAGITGSFYVNPGGVINLTNPDGFVDLSGFLYNYGGTINVFSNASYGDSYWPYNTNGGITMTGGVIDIKNVGVLVQNNGYTFTENITGGTIRSAGGFRVERGDYSPSGGTLELYGSTDGYFHTINAGSVFNVTVNKSPADFSTINAPLIFDRESGTYRDAPLTNTAIVDNILDINGDLTIQAGTLSAGVNTIYIAGDWDNNVGTSGFSEGTGLVVFDGADDADILSTETFYNLTLNKTFLYFDALEVNENIDVTNDLLLNDGTMEFNYPANLDVQGNLTINLNAGLNVNDFAAVVTVGGNWDNNNVTHAIETGFEPGLYSTVIFNGTLDQSLATDCAQEDFMNLTINKSAGKFRTYDNIQAFGDILIQSGQWDDWVNGLSHSIYGDFTVQSTGALLNVTNRNTIRMVGDLSSNINYSGSTGYFYSLYINKTGGASITQYGTISCQFTGSIVIDEGTYNMNGNYMFASGGVVINGGGTLSMPAGSDLSIVGGQTLEVNSGGLLTIAGLPADMATIRSNVTSSRYNFTVNSGGVIAANYCTFKHMTTNGVNVMNGAVIDPVNAFTGCVFQDGQSAGTLLTINNNQTVTIRNAVFPSNTWSGAWNVSKTLNQGQVYFVNYSGGFSGEAYDNDAFGRVTWVPVLTATATASPSAICAGSTSQLHANPSGGYGAYSYAWTPATGLSSTIIENPVASPGSTIVYNVVVTDALGTTASSSVTLTVNPYLPVSISIAASANPSPPGSYVLFTATPVNGGTSPAYQWKVNGINVGTGLPTYSYIPNYGDDVTCVLTSNYPCPTGNPATSNTITMIVVNTNTTVTGTVPSPLSLCFDASNTITVAGGGTTFTVESGGSVTMIAGQRIIYLPTTTVYSGGYMHGYITLANEYCGSLTPSMVSVVASAPESPAMTVKDQFLLFPNPTSGVFTLRQKPSGTYGTVKVEIFSTRGERLMSETIINEPARTFNMQSYPSGIYFIKVQKDMNTEVLKLVISK